MNIQDALNLITHFTGSNSHKVQALSGAHTQSDSTSRDSLLAALRQGKPPLPDELNDYLQAICPTLTLTVEGVGHPVEVLPLAELAWRPAMLASLTGELAKWQDDWFLIAHEGGDPIIIKTSERGQNSPVYSAMQGMGVWDFAPIADSIGQFLVCVCAIEHALNFPGLAQPLDDDFNLAPAAANWLFPFLRQHAGAHYDEWASVFENYQIG